MNLTPKQAEVLLHTSRTGRYVTSDPDVLEMADLGLLRDYGPQALAGGDHYLTTTARGRSSLNLWHAQQPKPKIIKRRSTAAFERWRDYCDAFGKISFSQFWKEVWPHQNNV